MGLDATQDAYDAALDRVITDLTATTPLRPDVAVDFTEPETQYRFDQCHWSALPEIEDQELATVELASRVQDDVLDELWGPVWPECPGHPHPARPVVHDGRAIWACPVNGRQVGVIGELPS